MTINFPGSLDNFTNPTSSNPINSPSHADQHANANDAIEALEAKVGVDGSTVATSHDYKIAQLESLVTSAVAGAKSIYQDVRNQSGSAFTKATPVYVSGSTGASGQMLISAASNAAESTSSKTMGLTTSAISNNSNGQVISEGILEGIDTTGAADGDPVWLGTDGAKIYGLANKPSAPAHLVFLGVVIRGGQANTGSMYVKIQNGFELQEIHNVEVSSLVNGNILAYDSTTQTWKNTNTIQSTSSTIPLIIKKVASQTVNLQEWNREDGVNLSRITDGGVIATIVSMYSPYYQGVNGGGGTIAVPYNQPIKITPQSSSITSLIVQGVSSQTADLQQWQNSSGTVLANIDASGNIYTSSTTIWAGYNRAADGSAVYNFTSVAGVNYTQASITRSSGFNGNLTIKQYGNGATVIQNGSATGIGLIVKGSSSQTANLQEWQDSTGTVLAKVTSAGDYFGRFVAIGGASTTYGTLSVSTYGTGIVGIIVRGLASQTADLQQWQNSAGTALALVDSSGNINTTSKLIAGNILDVTQSSATATGYGTSVTGDKIALFGSTSTPYYYGFGVQNSRLVAYVDSGQAFAVRVASSSGAKSSGSDSVILYGTGAGSFLLNSASTVGLIIKAAASQTANLQEWQNSSGGAMLFVGPNAQLRAGASIAGTGWAINNQQYGASVIAQVIRGATSQTANLQEWQNSSGTALAKVDANGNFSAISKSFDIPHPTKENMRLRYASLEGSENGVYIRGTVESNIIELPEYWTELVHEDSITVSLAAVGSAQNIYIEKIENNKVYIGGELTKAFFTVYGERKDIDKLVVEY